MSSGFDLKEKSKFTYDTSGNVLTQIAYLDDGTSDWSNATNPLLYVKMQYVYDTDNLNVTTFKTINVKDADGVNVDADGIIENSFDYDYFGNMISFEDGKGFVTSYEYDILGRMTKTIFPDGTFEEYDIIISSLTLVKQKKPCILIY